MRISEWCNKRMCELRTVRNRTRDVETDLKGLISKGSGADYCLL